VSACHNALAMEAAGLSRPRLYVGSWSQWSADPERPAATGDEPAGGAR
jgi:thiosulfate/3-mercaptopyruvate sulfurtransferase